jgi:PAS domain S-box-containing protein
VYLKKELYSKIQSDENIFDFIQDSALDGLWYWDLENPENEWMNARFWTVLGYNPDEMPHKSAAWQGIINQDDLKIASDNFIRHCENPNHPYDQIVRYTHKNGSTVWIRCRGMAIRDNTGRPIRMLGAHQDVTELKKREEELNKAKERIEESELTFRKLFEDSADAILLIDGTGVFVECNQAALNLLQMPREQFLLMTPITTSPEFQPNGRKSEEAALEMIELAYKNGQHRFDWAHINTKGEEFIVEVSLMPIVLKGQAMLHTAWRDITARKQAEEALRKSEAIKNTMVSNIGDVIVIIDQNGINQYKSPNITKLFGWKPEELIGKNTWDNVHPDDKEAGQKFIGTIAAVPNATGSTEVRYKRKDGEYVWIEISVINLLHDKDIQGILGNYRDITERRQVEKALEKRLVALTQPLDNPKGIDFEDLFNLTDIQRLQDEFAQATNVASIITKPDGTPITAPSNFTRLCSEIIRKTEIGCANCFKSDAAIGRPKPEGATLQPCLSGGLLDAGAAILVGNRHIANWMIGQVRNEEQSEEKIRDYAAQIGANEDDAAAAFRDVPFMSRKQFEQVSNTLFTLANLFSNTAYQNVQQARFISDRMQAEKELIKAKEHAENNNRINEERLKLIQFSENHTIDEFLEETLNSAEIISHSKIGFVHFVEQDQTNLLLQNWSTGTKQYYCNAKGMGFHYPIDKAGVWVDCVTERKPVIHNNYEALKHKKGLPEGHAALIRELVVPIIYNGNVKAIFGIGNKETDYNQIDVENISLLAYLAWEIVEKKKISEALVVAKEKAEESDRLKSAFLTNMSHEIRTPMNGILGFAEILKDPELSGDQQQEYIKIIEKSGKRMLNIINDIVDISKIEAGLMKPDLKESNINEQIEYIYTFFKPEVEAKGMKLSFKTTLSAKEATILTDREKVYAILTNLVKNAIKYSKQGSIELGYKIVETQCIASLQFYVKDTGIGIPLNRQEAIFERFIQADIADKMARQGAGLGLTISKAYVEMLGGKIWVESEEGKGSTFYFTLPYNTEPIAETIVRLPEPSGKNEIARKLKILIAEDDEVSEMLIDSYIKSFGRDFLKARTGVEAVEACRNNPDIDLILMDIRMPDMGGYEATQQIRRFNKEVIIIAQTAHGLTGDREKAIDAGCNDYISKPINKTDLLALIHKYFGK